LCRRRPDYGNPNLITYTSQDLLNEPGLVAYEDGYADARESGRNGFAADPSFTTEQRTRYLAGFLKGMRVYNARFNVQEVSTSQIKYVV